MDRGLYDSLITDALARALSALLPDAADIANLDSESAVDRLIDSVGAQLRSILSDLPGSTTSEQLLTQLGLVNDLLRHIRESNPSADKAEVDQLVTPPQVLRAIYPSADLKPTSPETGLATPWLFTAGRGSPSLLTELRRESAACDQIDILVSFITVSGVRKLIDILRYATAANASGQGRAKIRILTTTYTGATEIEALDALASLNGCEIRISLDGRRTRLHAKAWIFHRKTGFGSAYVGSANLSAAALADGVEWTVKFTERGQNALYQNAQAHFNTLWADGEFTRYDSQNNDNRNAIIDALRREGGQYQELPRTHFDIEPKPYQRDMLEQIARERTLGRTRNLIVAATGTGKTVIAALDYRAICAARGGDRPRLLFVAHRAQILRQALDTYRAVLRDHSFGELLTGGTRPQHHDHLFATIDTVTQRDLVARMGADNWHTVVIDECHRLAADRFDRLATTIRPTYLLGLTATPERADGQSIEKYFDPRPDSGPAVELRLWDALDMQLLSPFEYYACDDDTDFSDVPWGSLARETQAIASLVNFNQKRAELMIREWTRLTGNPRRGKAIVYCVSVEHARFITQKLNENGIKALCVVGDTPRADQIRAPKHLQRGDISALVTVDLYNEGVDIPEVDTLVLLRPTQSPVLFQQQIGRGLRLMPGNASCLILDFVGQQRVDFRFDKLLSGITGLTRRELIDAVEHGFGNLPPGCHILLQQQTRQQVLKGLKTLVHQTWKRLRSEAVAYSTLKGTRDIKLNEFLHDQHIDLTEIYRESRPSGWTSLKRSAGLLSGDEHADESDLSRRFGWLTHLDDPAQLRLMKRVAESASTYTPKNEQDEVRAQMLAYQLFNSGAFSYRDTLSKLEGIRTCAVELGELADVLSARSRLDEKEIPGLDDVPLQLHGAYEIREILTAVRYYTPEKRTPFQAGVLPLKERKIELLFVTLDKPVGTRASIAYKDYAISPELFHWQSQGAAGPRTTAGKRYIESRTNGWTFQLFVRLNDQEPYHACGPVATVNPDDDITGDKPMSIRWTLGVPLPPRLFSRFSVLRGQG